MDSKKEKALETARQRLRLKRKCEAQKREEKNAKRRKLHEQEARNKIAGNYSKE